MRFALIIFFLTVFPLVHADGNDAMLRNAIEHSNSIFVGEITSPVFGLGGGPIGSYRETYFCSVKPLQVLRGKVRKNTNVGGTRFQGETKFAPWQDSQDKWTEGSSHIFFDTYGLDGTIMSIPFTDANLAMVKHMIEDASYPLVEDRQRKRLPALN